MLKFKKEKIEMEVSLKKRIEFICDFAKVKPKFINGNVITIEHTKNTTSNLKDTNDLNVILKKYESDMKKHKKEVELMQYK